MSRKIGTREEVWSGMAAATKGGLRKGDLFYDAKSGKVKSRRVSQAAKARQGGRFKSTRKGMGFVPGNMQVGGAAFPSVHIPVGAGAYGPGAFPPGAFGMGVFLPGGGMAGAGLSGAGARQFIMRVLGALQRISPKIRRLINSSEATQLADAVVNALQATGIPQAQIAAMSITKMLPVVRKVINQLLALVPEKKGAGVFLPGY